MRKDLVKLDKRSAELIGKTFSDYAKSGNSITLKRRLHMLELNYKKKIILR